MNFCSDFKYDLEQAKVTEVEVADILGNKNIEVKHDKGAHRTGNVFVEYESRGKASGISTTKADYWAFIINDRQTVIHIATEKLKERCRQYIGTMRDTKGGDNQTSKGILLPIFDLI